jgi:catechol 2,3-dioxygenase-like lactoylglutathione lyase family enzyme
MARIQASRFVLAVRDLKISTDYYVNVLGFTRDAIEAEGWSFLSRNTVLVMLGECRNEKPASELGDHSYFAYWIPGERRDPDLPPAEQALGPARVQPENPRRPPHHVRSGVVTAIVTLA